MSRVTYLGGALIGAAGLAAAACLNKGNNSSHRLDTVDSLGGLISMNNALHAPGAGVAEDFKKMRHLTNLTVHRIRDVILTDKPVLFDIPESEPGMFGLPWHEPRKFFIHCKTGIAADYVRERIWVDSQMLE